jgi:hypothetical protein
MMPVPTIHNPATFPAMTAEEHRALTVTVPRLFVAYLLDNCTDLARRHSGPDAYWGEVTLGGIQVCDDSLADGEDTIHAVVGVISWATFAEYFDPHPVWHEVTA